MSVDVDALPPGFPITDVIGRTRWTVERRIGAGGFGVVYRVRDVDNLRPRALKILRRHRIADLKNREAFVREARATGRFEGPARELVVDVLETGVLEDAPWLLMELLQGRPLSAAVASGPLSAQQTVEVMFDVATVLEEAARRGLVHRDLKPENLFVQDKGRTTQVKVVDFGLAIGLQSSAPEPDARIVGTPRYMAPEQFGDPRTIGPKTDMWPFGLVAYFCLVGRHFFPDDTNWERHSHRILGEPLPTASEAASRVGGSVPVGFDDWLSACLSRSSGERPGPMEAIGALARLLSIELPRLSNSVATDPASGETGAATTVDPVPSEPPAANGSSSENATPPAVTLGWRASVFEQRALPVREVRIILRRIAAALDARRAEQPGSLLRVADIRLQSIAGEWNVGVEPSAPEAPASELLRSRTIAARIDEISCLPPEVFRGTPLTGASDAWILAMVAYRLLVGRSYFKAADVAALQKAHDVTMRPASKGAAEAGVKLSAGFDRWFEQCTRANPGERPTSATAAARAFPAGHESWFLLAALSALALFASFAVYRMTRRPPVLVPPLPAGQAWIAVRAPSPFEMLQHEVSCADFSAYLEAVARLPPNTESPRPPTYCAGRLPDAPATGLDPTRARGFCRHYGGDLPSIEQWRAAVGGFEAARQRLRWPTRLSDYDDPEVQRTTRLSDAVIGGDETSQHPRPITGLLTGVGEWLRPTGAQTDQAYVGLSPLLHANEPGEEVARLLVEEPSSDLMTPRHIGFRCVRPTPNPAR